LPNITLCAGSASAAASTVDDQRTRFHPVFDILGNAATKIALHVLLLALVTEPSSKLKPHVQLLRQHATMNLCQTSKKR
jgi:hypothetical protein